MANAFNALQDGGMMFSFNSCADGIPNYSHPRAQFDPVTRIALNRTRYWATLSERLSEFESAGFVVEYIELKQKPLEDFSSDLAIYARKTAGGSR